MKSILVLLALAVASSAFAKNDARSLLQEAEDFVQSELAVRNANINVKTRNNLRQLSEQNVAIIGAGGSGLFTASMLRQKGISVSIFEEKDEVGGISRTEKIQGNYYDMSTMWVPKGSASGYGIDPCLNSMINQAVGSSRLEEAERPFSFNGTDIPSTIYSILEKYPHNLIIDQLIRQYAYFVCALNGECGYVSMTDPANFQIPVMRELSSFVVDFNRGAMDATFGQVPFEPDFVPPTVHYILNALGVNLSNLPANAPPSLRSFFQATMESTVPFYRFEKGYQTFLVDLSHALKVTLKRRAKVTALILESDGTWTVEVTHSQSKPKLYRGFTRVISTAPPEVTAALLTYSQHQAMKELLVQAATMDNAEVGRSFLFEANSVPISGGRWVINPKNKNYGSPQIDRSPVGFILKRYSDSKVMLLGGYSGALSEDDFIIQSKTFIKNYLNIDSDLDDNAIYVGSGGFPKLARGYTTPWFANVTANQAINGLIVTGEAVSGSTMPRICRFAKSIVDGFFP